MKIAIIGAGFLGLTAAFRLTQKGHSVEIFEKEDKPGGLAAGFKIKGFDWPIEKHYHHLFTNDSAIQNLIKEVGLNNKLIFPASLTSLFYGDKIYPFNTPRDILSFSPLSFSSRLRLSAVTAYLKFLPKNLALGLEKYSATSYINKYYGQKIYTTVWEPLLFGKFGKYKDTVNMAWFWARIKKRTLTLGYIEGGFQTLADKLYEKIQKSGGKVYLKTPFDPHTVKNYDKVIATTPSPIFLKLFPQLPANYKTNFFRIHHLHALNMLLVSKNKFFPDNTYWLNINDKNFPFIAVVEHTNFIDPKHYGKRHLLYIGNYLPTNHPFLKMSKEELLHVYLPYLKRINPAFNSQSSILNSQLFLGPFAQPVVPINYSKFIPSYKTPIPNVYLANLDMVYPWDRGTNYAVELGNKVAEYISGDR